MREEENEENTAVSEQRWLKWYKTPIIALFWMWMVDRLHVFADSISRRTLNDSFLIHCSWHCQRPFLSHYGFNCRRCRPGGRVCRESTEASPFCAHTTLTRIYVSFSDVVLVSSFFSLSFSLSLFVFAALFEVGTPITGTPCSFTVTPHKNKSDVFISPTYPGAYPKDMSCTYHFIGEPSQRVRLEFRDFDLFFGGPQ